MTFQLHPFISQLLASPPGWLTYSSIIKSSRTELLRNLAAFNFPPKLSQPDQKKVWSLISSTANGIWGDTASHLFLEDLSPLERGLLIESELLPEELGSEPEGKGLIIQNDYHEWVLVNYNNHLTFGTTAAGLDLKSNFGLTNHLDDRFSERLDMAFDKRLGFLTSSPDNVGTGLVASISIQLPALMILKQIHRVFNGISALGLTIKSSDGKTLPLTGNTLQISNQTALGVAEEDILERLETVAETLEYHEANAREALRKEARLQLVDKVERARGLLLHTQLLSTHEALSLLAALRLGVEMGLSDFPDLDTLDSLSLRVQPARLQLEHGEVLEHTDREAYRAELVRNSLNY